MTATIEREEIYTILFFSNIGRLALGNMSTFVRGDAPEEISEMS